MIGYHGSHLRNRNPEPSRMGDYGPGFYFASDIEDARGYGPHIYQADLVVTNPLLVSMKLTPEQDKLRKALKLTEEDLDTPHWASMFAMANSLVEVGLISLRSVINYIKKLGYDSIVVPADIIKATYPKTHGRTRGNYIIVFDVEQIKGWAHAS